MGGLNPAQWAALRYFARANRFSRTVGAFARYHGTTRGTATQTVKALVDKRFLTRQAVKRDRRSVGLRLTEKANKCLLRDPFHDLEHAASALSQDQRSTLAKWLQTMLERILMQRGRALFGVCPSCVHLRCEACQAGSEYECELLGEPLKKEDLAAICVNYEPKSTSAAHADG